MEGVWRAAFGGRSGLEVDLDDGESVKSRILFQARKL